MTIAVGSEWIRKRDGTRVRVDAVTSRKVVYRTLPMLIVWCTPVASFRNNFRPAPVDNTAADAHGGERGAK